MTVDAQDGIVIAARRDFPAEIGAAGKAARLSLAVTFTVYAASFLALAFPWLSGAVTIPWDAKAQFQPQLSFLAASLAHGQSPLWTPNVFAGWPQVADPQSLLFSPLHLALAWIDPGVDFRAADAAT